jgi:hypothetical protein
VEQQIMSELTNQIESRKEIKYDHLPNPGIGKLGFRIDAVWKKILGQLANYREMHGHCNVPQRYSENTKLCTWVSTQRKQYKLHIKGKKSQMTLPRIQELESLGFEWNPRSFSRGKAF